MTAAEPAPAAPAAAPIPDAAIPAQPVAATTAQILQGIWQQGQAATTTDAATPGRLRLTRALGRGLLDLIYPPQCPITGGNLADQPNPWLSAEALANLPYLEAPFCPRCGGPQEAPARNAAAEPRCRRCATCEGGFQRSVCLWEYEAAGRDLVLCYKFGAQRHLAILLGRWLYAVARSRDLFHGATWLCPAPGSQTMSALVAEENHATQLAHAIARADAEAAQPLGLRVLAQGLHKLRATTPQALLPLKERLLEPVGAMDCPHPDAVRGECIVLVDDVLTTLATASEAARALTAAGAREVRVLALARTL